MDNHSKSSSQNRSQRSTKSKSSSSSSGLDSLASRPKRTKVRKDAEPSAPYVPKLSARPVSPKLSYRDVLAGRTVLTAHSQSRSDSREPSPAGRENSVADLPPPSAPIIADQEMPLEPWTVVRRRRSSHSSGSSSKEESPKHVRSMPTEDVGKMSNKKFHRFLYDPGCKKCDAKHQRPCVQTIREVAQRVASSGYLGTEFYDRIVAHGAELAAKFSPKARYCHKCAGHHLTEQHRDRVKSRMQAGVVSSVSGSESEGTSSPRRASDILRPEAEKNTPQATPSSPLPRTRAALDKPIFPEKKITVVVPKNGKVGAPTSSSPTASSSDPSSTPPSKGSGKSQKKAKGTRQGKKSKAVSADAANDASREAGNRDAAAEKKAEASGSETMRAWREGLAVPILDPEAYDEANKKAMSHPLFAKLRALSVMNDVVPDITSLDSVCQCLIVKTMFDAVFLKMGGHFELADWMRFRLPTLSADWVEVLLRDVENVVLVTGQLKGMQHYQGLFPGLTAADLVLQYPARYHHGPPTSPPNGGPSSFLAQKQDLRAESLFAFAEKAAVPAQMPLDLPLLASYGRQLAHLLLTTLLPTAGALAMIGGSPVPLVGKWAFLGAAVGLRCWSTMLATRREQLVVHQVEVVDTPSPLGVVGDGRPDAMMFGPIKHVARPLRVVHNVQVIDREVPDSFFSPFPDDGLNFRPHNRFFKQMPCMGMSTKGYTSPSGVFLFATRTALLTPFVYYNVAELARRELLKDALPDLMEAVRLGELMPAQIPRMRHFLLEMFLPRTHANKFLIGCVAFGIMWVVTSCHSVRAPHSAFNPPNVPGVLQEYAGLSFGFPADGELDAQLRGPRIYAASTSRKDVEAAIRRQMASTSSINVNRDDPQAHMLYQGNLVLALLRWAHLRAEALPHRLFVDGGQGGAKGPN